MSHTAPDGPSEIAYLNNAQPYEDFSIGDGNDLEVIS